MWQNAKAHGTPPSKPTFARVDSVWLATQGEATGFFSNGTGAAPAADDVETLDQVKGGVRAAGISSVSAARDFDPISWRQMRNGPAAVQASMPKPDLRAADSIETGLFRRRLSNSPPGSKDASARGSLSAGVWK